MDQLLLMMPEKVYADAIKEYRESFLSAGDSMDGTGALYRMPEAEDWLNYVAQLSNPATVPEDMVPTSQYICVRPYDNKLVGMIQLRRNLNEYLEQYGGHVEFSVLPDERGKGYATWMLKNILRYARDCDIHRVILAVEPRNAAGRRVIEKNGGVFIDKVLDPEYELEFERFGIEV